MFRKFIDRRRNKYESKRYRAGFSWAMARYFIDNVSTNFIEGGAVTTQTQPENYFSRGAKFAVDVIRNMFEKNSELNKRVAVENYLLECAAGKRPLPDKEACRILALRLGTPKNLWSDKLRQKLP